MNNVQKAFDVLVMELERLYGKSHTNDFQDELDQLATAIKEASNVSDNKTGGRPPVGKVSTAK